MDMLLYWKDLSGSFFPYQIDYLYFIEGLCLLLVALVLSPIRERHLNRLAWIWMQAFFAFQGLAIWLYMTTYTYYQTEGNLLLCIASYAVVGASLVEFGRQNWKDSNGNKPGIGIYAFLLAMTLPGILGGWYGMLVSVRIVFGLAGGLWAFLVLYRSIKELEEHSQALWRIFDGLLLAYFLLMSLIQINATDYPLHILTNDPVYLMTGIPVCLMRMGLEAGLILVLWKLDSSSGNVSADRQTGSYTLNKAVYLPVLLVILIGSGWMYTQWFGYTRVEERKLGIMNRTSLAAAALDSRLLRPLQWEDGDQNRAEYNLLRSKMHEMKTTDENIVFVYLMGLNEGVIVFGPDSPDEEDYSYTEGPVPYEQPPPELFEVFTTGQPVVVGPYSDEWGTYVSGFAPVLNSESQEIIAVLGVDIDAGTWMQDYFGFRMPAILITLLVSMLSLAFMTGSRRLKSMSDKVLATEKDLAEARLKELEDRYRSLFNNSHTMMMIIEPNSGKIIDANPAACTYYGYSYNEMCSMRITEINTMNAEEIQSEMHRARLEERSRFYFTHRLIDGRMRDVEVFSGPITVNGRDLLYSIVHDITERRTAQRELVKEHQLSQMYLDIAGVMIIIIDNDFNIQMINRHGLEILQLNENDVLGQNFFDRFVPEAERNEIREQYKRWISAAGSGVLNNSINPIITGSGERRMISWHHSMIKEASGEITALLSSGDDITDLIEAQNALRELSLTDELTGLYNRRGFVTLTMQQFKIADRINRGLTLFYIDIDNMKWINDNLGHLAGDQALQDTALILKNSFRASDIIARIGGDEFCSAAMENAAMDIQNILNRLNENVQAHNLEGQRLFKLSLSIGKAAYTPGQKSTLEELLEQADIEMYTDKQAKKNGRGDMI